MSDPAGIAAQPADLNVCAGSNGSFSVTASGAATGYQWQVSTDGGATWSNISGATTSTLSLSAISNSSNYKYRVIISSCDPNGITSNAVTLTVNSPAVIGTQPLNQTGCTGSSVTFSSGATGTGISYQWQVSTNGGSAFNDIPGETGSSLTLTGITSSMNQNQYQVVVNSSACPGAVNSSAATLIVTDPTSILAQPGNPDRFVQEATEVSRSTPPDQAIPTNGRLAPMVAPPGRTLAEPIPPHYHYQPSPVQVITTNTGLSFQHATLTGSLQMQQS